MKENKKERLPIFNFGYYCPHCYKKIVSRKPDDYGENEVHPCEHCDELILWTPRWSLKDIRD